MLQLHELHLVFTAVPTNIDICCLRWPHLNEPNRLPQKAYGAQSHPSWFCIITHSPVSIFFYTIHLLAHAGVYRTHILCVIRLANNAILFHPVYEKSFSRNCYVYQTVYVTACVKNFEVIGLNVTLCVQYLCGQFLMSAVVDRAF